MHIRAVIFDMDGLLLDSERLWLGCWKEAAPGLGLPMDIAEDCAVRSIGTTKEMTRQIFEEVAGEGFSYDRFEEKALGLFYKAEAEGRLLLKPGAERILRSLREAAIRTALATSTAEEIATRQMRERGLLDLFDVRVFGSQVARSKPAPDIFLRAAELLDTPPADCLVLEDSYNGIRAAHNAGMHSIMVPDLLQPDSEIRGLADAVLPDLDTVTSYLLSSDTDQNSCIKGQER